MTTAGKPRFTMGTLTFILPVQELWLHREDSAYKSSTYADAGQSAGKVSSHTGNYVKV